MKNNKTKSNPVFERLNIFAGDWEMEASKDGVPLAKAQTIVEWNEKRAFLVYHSEAEPPLPATPQIWIDNNPNPIVVIIGLDDYSRIFFFNYVRRTYQMSFENSLWKFWGRAENFFQCFEGRFNSDNNIITGNVESSEDGTNRELDFDVKYTGR